MLFNIVPREFISKTNESELLIYFRNGSIYQLKGADDPDALRGAGPKGLVLDEFAKIKPDAWMVLEPILRQNMGWAWFIGTPKGRNHLYDFFQRGQEDSAVYNPEWKSWIMKASTSGIIAPDQLEQSRQTMTVGDYNQEWECFVPETDIITLGGVKRISEVGVGDMVLTHTNKYQKVLGISIRQFKGDLLKIKTFGNNKEILCTPEHPFRVTNGRNNFWIKAKDLKKGQLVTFAKPLLGRNKVIKRELAHLIAWFVAEGNFSHNKLTFSIGEHEKEYVEEVCGLLKECSSKKLKVNTSQGCTVVGVNDGELGKFMVSVCGSGARFKKLPIEILSGYEKEVYEILIKGDGCNVNNSKDSYATVSKTLAYQVQLLAHSLSWSASVSERTVSGLGTILKRTVSLSDQFVVRIYKKQPKIGTKIKVHKYNISASINNIESFPYDGLVYNLEVSEDNSYTANGRVVHNCEFLEGEGQVFRGVRNICISVPRKPEANHLYVMGVDLAKVTDFTVLCVYDRATNQQVYQDRFQTLEWPFQKKKIGEAARYYNNALVILDATGLGDPIADDLARTGIAVEPFKISEPSKKELIEKLSIWIDQQKIFILPTKETFDEFDNFSYDIGITGKIRYGAKPPHHDDIVMAHALAVFGLNPIVPVIRETLIPKVKLEYARQKRNYERQDGWEFPIENFDF